ncbi:MAG: hypothetical protein ABIO65_10855, partial [Nitrospiria bacterium]
MEQDLEAGQVREGKLQSHRGRDRGAEGAEGRFHHLRDGGHVRVVVGRDELANKVGFGQHARDIALP